MISGARARGPRVLVLGATGRRGRALDGSAELDEVRVLLAMLCATWMTGEIWGMGR